MCYSGSLGAIYAVSNEEQRVFMQRQNNQLEEQREEQRTFIQRQNEEQHSFLERHMDILERQGAHLEMVFERVNPLEMSLRETVSQ